MEVLDITAIVEKNKLRIVIVYRPPDLSVPNFLEDFCEICENEITSGPRLLIVGDINIHLDNPDNNQAKKFNERLNMYSLKQFVTEKTHRSGHTLDVIISNNEPMVSKVKVDPVGISDHFPVHCVLNLPVSKKETKTIRFRRLKNINLDNFKNDIQHSDLGFISQQDVTEAIKVYNSVLKELLEKHAPIIEKTIVDRPNSEWYGEEIRVMKRKVRQKERKWRISGKLEDLEEYKEEFNIMNDAIKEKKCSYYINKVTESQNDQKKLYKIVNNLLKPGEKSSLPRNNDIKKLCDDFVQFFDNKIKVIRTKLGESMEGDPHLTERRHEDISDMSAFQLVNEEEIAGIIGKMKDKTCALDPIPTCLLKKCLDVLVPFITIIVNLSIIENVVPSDLKEALITPIIKKLGLDPEIFGNFRPVSNLTFISKILEKVILRQLMGHLTFNDLLEALQSAYKEKHSTETALLKVHNDIMTHLDSGRAVALVLLDQSAAFDTVDHKILIRRLENYYNITGTALRWFSSYLSHRTQAVCINNVCSEYIPLSSGVPQGSVLGPVLFSLYSQPLVEILEKWGTEFHLYADDTQLYMSFTCNNQTNDYLTITNVLKSCLDEVRHWMTKNFLKLNEEKTEFMLIGSKAQLELLGNNSVISIAQSNITSCDNARNIGLIIDKNFDMNAQISNVVRLCFLNIRKIYFIRKFLTTKSTKNIVQALVISRLDYLNCLYVSLPSTVLNKLQRCQNAAARLISKTPKQQHITPILRELHWLPVKQRIKFKILVYTFKCLRGECPLYLSNMINDYAPNRTLRSEELHLLQETNYRTTRYGLRRFEVIAPKLWNTLPLGIKTSNSTRSFKRNLKTFLFDQTFNVI
jgi:hypothetical protein